MSSTEFEAIYRNGGWDGQGSGPGSTPLFTQVFRAWLEGFIKAKGIQSVLDVGCGDWQWASLVDWNEAKYHGLDVVPSVIEENQRRYGSDRVIFQCADAQECDWPSVDLVIIKDLVHHVPKEEVPALIQKSAWARYTLWVVDMEGDRVCNTTDETMRYFRRLEHVFEFDVTVPGYRYGRKAAWLRENV